MMGWENISRSLTFEQVVSHGMLVVNLYVFKAIILCFMLLLILYQLRDKQLPFLHLLGEYSFGLFFTHYLFISLTRKIVETMDVTIEFSVPAYLTYFLLILALSTATVYLVKKLSGRYSRYLIGS
mgnify:CR=1 FL=1